MRDIQLIYTSRPFGFDGTTLDAILFTARHRNKRDGITGALICRDDIFIQLLEGRAEAVSATYARIERDGRHIDIAKLWTSEIDRRLFPRWEMWHDPAQSWMWSRADVEAGEVLRAPVSALYATFERSAAEAVLTDHARVGSAPNAVPLQ